MVVMELEVKQVKGIESPTCGCSDFLCHWENYAEKKAGLCFRDTCNHTTELFGAQVINQDNPGEMPYVIPLCKSCSEELESSYFKLKANWILVRVSSHFRCAPCAANQPE